MDKLLKTIKKLNINADQYEICGKEIAKLKYWKFEDENKKGKLILMTSINPTAAGEGKTTTAISLADGLNYIGKKAILALREPSLGPVFGSKGTATGGGQSIVEPMERINLHFTGDLHAITSANNLISATIDNELYWGNKLNINCEKIIWKRCMDLNDRSLREVEINIKKNLKRKESFTITAASNIMTTLCLSKNLNDFKQRLENSIVAYDNDNNPIFMEQLKITGAVLALLLYAIRPNLVLTKYNSPALIHLGPFANIATGTNSIISTSLGLKLSEYTIVESGFGSDLGFEKFMNLINYQNDLVPDCVVMVITLRALKLHDDFNNSFKHLEAHLKHVTLYNLNLVVAINFIEGDSVEDLKKLQEWLGANNYEWEMNNGYNLGPKGSEELAKKVIKACDTEQNFKPLITPTDSIIEKINKVVKNFYYLNEFIIEDECLEKIKVLEKSEYKDYPICMVKDHSNIDGNITKDKNYVLKIKNVEVNSGAKFILVYTNNIFSMPGLSKDANYKNIYLLDYKIVGLK
ncbi:formate--tetrahydrofolate ligase [Spiroplasma helicoides]|uniref:Formate--tetrahydrofolate ligase n=1 Tax=Spiroplasma helicoides TaxID=216938 RepID=A0A1B3SJJ9_9MOLU|nr:formate--tetrahydrofolate ligase [Spiroplasma helicoides]AOG60109.1 formate--tetrahydrofolate ligase [Spiroplasma helicoides]